ncbi:hypothetical protein GGS21DRAFT_486630 [Xylaria nigripes]|nr:hypothetical protein GGS21DRAFT_486630 [Xylaria nigripes]
MVGERNSFARIRFTRADVPPLEFWHASARPPLILDLSAEECLQAVQDYVDVALKNAPRWQQRLINTNDNAAVQSPHGNNKNQGLSAYKLHYVALAMMQLSGKPMHISMHILHNLTTLDYTPAILTLANMALRFKRVNWPQFEVTFERFERMLKAIGDGSDSKSGSRGSKIEYAADACTLRALIYASENTYEGDNNALRWFRRALEVGAAAESDAKTSPATADKLSRQQIEEDGQVVSESPDMPQSNFDPRWQWKASFALGVGAIHMKRGKTQEARDMYMMASKDLDNPKGYYKLAELLETMGEADTRDYVESLEKAAVSGDNDAARKLGERESGRAAGGNLSGWEKRRSQVLAEEWMAMADASVPKKG